MINVVFVFRELSSDSCFHLLGYAKSKLLLNGTVSAIPVRKQALQVQVLFATVRCPVQNHGYGNVAWEIFENCFGKFVNLFFGNIIW